MLMGGNGQVLGTAWGPHVMLADSWGMAPGAYPISRKQVGGEEHLLSSPGARLNGDWLFLNLL